MKELTTKDFIKEISSVCSDGKLNICLIGDVRRGMSHLDFGLYKKTHKK